MHTSIAKFASTSGKLALGLGLGAAIFLFAGCGEFTPNCPPPPPCVYGEEVEYAGMADIVESDGILSYDAGSEPIEIIVPGAVSLAPAEDGTYLTDADTEAGSARSEGPIRVKVKFLRAIDGNTVHVLWDGQDVGVQLAGLRAPELNEEGYGESGLFLRNLISTDEVELEFTDGTIKYDKNGRLLAVLWIDGMNVNQAMILGGKAEALDAPTTVKEKETKETIEPSEPPEVKETGTLENV